MGGEGVGEAGEAATDVVKEATSVVKDLFGSIWGDE